MSASEARDALFSILSLHRRDVTVSVYDTDNTGVRVTDYRTANKMEANDAWACVDARKVVYHNISELIYMYLKKKFTYLLNSNA